MHRRHTGPALAARARPFLARSLVRASAHLLQEKKQKRGRSMRPSLLRQGQKKTLIIPRVASILVRGPQRLPLAFGT